MEWRWRRSLVEVCQRAGSVESAQALSLLQLLQLAAEKDATAITPHLHHLSPLIGSQEALPALLNLYLLLLSKVRVKS